MRWAFLISVLAAGEAASQRERWLLKVEETAPLDCKDTFSAFRSTLKITDHRIDLAGRIKSTVIKHLLRKMVRWSDDDLVTTVPATDSYSGAVLGNVNWLENETTETAGESSVEQSSAPTISTTPPKEAQLYEHDKLLGRQTLDRLKVAIQAYFDKTGLISTIWHSATDRNEDADAEMASSSLQAEEYFNSPYTENLLNQIISDASFSIFPNISLTVQSAMVNLGEALCRTTELSQYSVEQSQLDRFTCATHALLEMGLTCNARDIQTPDCDNPVIEQSLICDIPEIGVQDPFSNTFAVDLDIIAPTDNHFVPLAQGNADRWLLRAVSQLYKYTKYDVVCEDDVEATLGTMLPGWVPISDIWLDYSQIINLNQTQMNAPFSIIMKKPSSCDFVVVNRGSVFKSDWLIDFDYELVDLIYKPEDFAIPDKDGRKSAIPSTRLESLGKLSKGYERIAVDTAKILIHHILQTECADVNSIVFTGHSMGGIIGAAQALLVSSLFSERAGRQPKLSVISFAAPSAVDRTFKELIDERATVRGWVIELDAVSKIPCENPLPSCTQLSRNVPSDQILRSKHDALPNTITIPNSLLAELMPTLGEDSFGTVSYNVFTGNLNLDSITFPGTTLFAQTHTCAYTCWMNAVYCSMASAREVCMACIGQ